MRTIVGKRCQVEDPFVEVSVSPVTVEGQEVPQLAVVLHDPTKQDPVFVASHSPSYQLVSNRNAWDFGKEVFGQAGLSFEEQRIFWNGKKFLGLISTPDVKFKDPREGDCEFAMEVINSYDGTLRFGVRFILYRLICSNGLYFSRVLGSYLFKHLGENQLEVAAQYISEAADRFLGLQPNLERLAEIDIDLQTVLNWHNRLLDEGWTDSNTGKVLSQLDPSAHHSMWDLVNAYTHVTEHVVQGIRGATLSEKVCELALSNAV